MGVQSIGNKHIIFDSGIGLLNLVDEFDREERAYFGVEEEIKGMKDIRKTYELSQPYKIPSKMPFQIPYRHLVTLVQIGKNWEVIKKILLRTGQINDNLSLNDEKRLRCRSENVKYWLDKFAPDMVKFEVKKQMPKITLFEEQKNFIKSLLKSMSEIDWNAETIHNCIYQISENKKFMTKNAFKLIYELILGQSNGPRAGYFLSNLDKNFVLERFEEAIK